MSPGLRVLQAARAAGITVQLDGEFLSLQADGVPDDELLELLRQRKGEIVELLRLQLFDPDATQLAGTTAAGGATPRDTVCGEVVLAEVCSASVEEAVAEAILTGVCAGCGGAFGGGHVLELADGAWVHFVDDRCLLRYGERRGVIPAAPEPDETRCGGCGEEFRPGERRYAYTNPDGSDSGFCCHSESLACLIAWNERWHAAAGHEYDAAFYCRHLDEAGWRTYRRLRRRWRLASAGDR